MSCSLSWGAKPRGRKPLKPCPDGPPRPSTTCLPMPGLRTLAVLTDLPACVEQDEFRNKTELHADGSNSRSGQLSELPFSNSAFHSPSWPIVIIVKLVLSARVHIAVCNCGERRVLKDARTTARVIQTVLICPYGPLDLSSTPKTGKLARRITRPITGAAHALSIRGLRARYRPARTAPRGCADPRRAASLRPPRTPDFEPRACCQQRRFDRFNLGRTHRFGIRAGHPH